MQRVFTKAIGRFQRGQVADYPKATWEQIAKSAGASLDSFSMLSEEALARSARDQSAKVKVA